MNTGNINNGPFGNQFRVEVESQEQNGVISYKIFFYSIEGEVLGSVDFTRDKDGASVDNITNIYSAQYLSNDLLDSFLGRGSSFGDGVKGFGSEILAYTLDYLRKLDGTLQSVLINTGTDSKEVILGLVKRVSQNCSDILSEVLIFSDDNGESVCAIKLK